MPWRRNPPAAFDRSGAILATADGWLPAWETFAKLRDLRTRRPRSWTCRTLIRHPELVSGSIGPHVPKRSDLPDGAARPRMERELRAGRKWIPEAKLCLHKQVRR